MALYSLDNVPVHQTTSVRYDRPMENIINGNYGLTVNLTMSFLSNVAMEINMPEYTHVVYLFPESVIFLFAGEQKWTH